MAIFIYDTDLYEKLRPKYKLSALKEKISSIGYEIVTDRGDYRVEWYFCFSLKSGKSFWHFGAVWSVTFPIKSTKSVSALGVWYVLFCEEKYQKSPLFGVTFWGHACAVEAHCSEYFFPSPSSFRKSLSNRLQYSVGSISHYPTIVDRANGKKGFVQTHILCVALNNVLGTPTANSSKLILSQAYATFCSNR